MKRTDYLAWAFIGSGFGFGAWFYGDLPDPMPTHFNAQGLVDGYTALPWGPFIIPLVTIGVYLLLKILPAISPREFAMDRFRGAFAAVIVGVVGVLTAIQFILLRTAIDPTFNPLPWIQVMVGAIFLVTANYITKTEPNFFFGIRTPWTLANEEVWFRTHRQAGYLLALAGIISILSAPFEFGLIVTVAATISTALWLVVYSYILYVKINKNGGQPTA